MYILQKHKVVLQSEAILHASEVEGREINKQTYFHWTFSSHDSTVPRLYYFITSRKLKHSSIYTHFQSNAAIKVAPTPHYNWLQRVGFVDRHIYICTATLHLHDW